MNKSEELEYKFKAENVSFKAFDDLMMKDHKAVFIHAACPDVYYRQGENVTRHRLSDGPGELTVKYRKSEDSIKDRVEIDLNLNGADLTKEEVAAYTVASGWTKEFEIDKDSYIYTVHRGSSGITSVLAYYTVNLIGSDDKNSYIEVEIQKDNDATKKEGFKELTWWKKELQSKLGLDEPMNLSLYEIFSGKSYKIKE